MCCCKRMSSVTESPETGPETGPETRQYKAFGWRESWAFIAVTVFLSLAGFFMVDGGERALEPLDRAPDP